MPKAKEFYLYHGIALTRLVHDAKLLRSIQKPPGSNASYIINGDIGIFIKYSAKRLSPWRFTFLREHQNEILAIKNKMKQVYIVLVCHHDGIVTLSFDEFKMILDHKHEETEWVSIERRRNEMYTVMGSDGSLNFKVGDSAFPEKLLH